MGIGKLAGSSPHTRGARRWSTRRAAGRGIIPAYAGSTYREIGFETIDMDHPRIRGEHAISEWLGSDDAGSSPHTRGAREDERVSRVGEGIIPAYAGSTGDDPSQERSRRDHPRIRGEHRPAARRVDHLLGSSPHTRGAPWTWAVSGTAKKDHPRIRGEHAAWMPSIIIASGSSPHTRGARVPGDPRR